MAAKHHWIAGLVLVNFLAGGRVCAADPPDWENEQVIHINTEAPRATFVPFPDVEAALAGNHESSPIFPFARGRVEIQLVHRNRRAGRPIFSKRTSTIQAGKRLTVPSNWEMKGYGVPIYLGRVTRSKWIRRA